MKEMTVDGIKFTSYDDAISYINEIKQAEIELAESKRIEERTKRLNEIEDMAENLIELIDEVEQEHKVVLTSYNIRVKELLESIFIQGGGERFDSLDKSFDDRPRICKKILFK